MLPLPRSFTSLLEEAKQLRYPDRLAQAQSIFPFIHTVHAAGADYLIANLAFLLFVLLLTRLPFVLRRLPKSCPSPSDRPTVFCLR